MSRKNKLLRLVEKLTSATLEKNRVVEKSNILFLEKLQEDFEGTEILKIGCKMHLNTNQQTQQ